MTENKVGGGKGDRPIQSFINRNRGGKIGDIRY